MPRFTLIKHPTSKLDSEVTITFDAELLDVARNHYDDFLKAAGFEIPLEEDKFEFKITEDEFVAREEEWLWDDALASKFQTAQTDPMDGLLRSASNDVVFLGDYQKEPFVPTLHD